MHSLYHGDCLDILPTLPAQSVDAIIADPPYGTTACKWDSVIPLDAMWRELKRVIKPNGAIVLFGAQPFTSVLVTSNLDWYKYAWYWHKNIVSGFQLATIQPTRAIEEVCVFYGKQCTYNRQPTKSIISDRKVTPGRKNGGYTPSEKNDHMLGTKRQQYIFPEYIAPRNVLEIPCVPRATGYLHPTQKPVDLMRYLVRTYTNAGETVLDFTAGSGSTGVAALIEGRRFIGIEKEANYYAIMERRCAEVIAQPALMVTEHA